jgi:hypothetical protein
MVVQLLMGLLADLVFESAASMRRSFTEEVDHYLQQPGSGRGKTTPTPTR